LGIEVEIGFISFPPFATFLEKAAKETDHEKAAKLLSTAQRYEIKAEAARQKTREVIAKVREWLKNY